jgi:hypothetical protein
MPSREEQRERHDSPHDDVPRRGHGTPPAHEDSSRYPLSFARAKLGLISAILL